MPSHVGQRVECLQLQAPGRCASYLWIKKKMCKYRRKRALRFYQCGAALTNWPDNFQGHVLLTHKAGLVGLRGGDGIRADLVFGFASASNPSRRYIVPRFLLTEVSFSRTSSFLEEWIPSPRGSKTFRVPTWWEVKGTWTKILPLGDLDGQCNE